MNLNDVQFYWEPNSHSKKLFTKKNIANMDGHTYLNKASFRDSAIPIDDPMFDTDKRIIVRTALYSEHHEMHARACVYMREITYSMLHYRAQPGMPLGRVGWDVEPMASMPILATMNTTGRYIYNMSTKGIIFNDDLEQRIKGESPTPPKYETHARDLAAYAMSARTQPLYAGLQLRIPAIMDEIFRVMQVLAQGLHEFDNLKVPEKKGKKKP